MANRRTSEIPQSQPTISAATAHKRIRRLIEQIPSFRADTNRDESPEFLSWQQQVALLLADFYGHPSLPAKQFSDIHFAPMFYYEKQPDREVIEYRQRGLDQAHQFLTSREEDIAERLPQVTDNARLPEPTAKSSGNVFVVHGHDETWKQTVARFISKIELNPIILHEMPDMGRTIIEKFEAHANDARCAIVLLTPDDQVVNDGHPIEKRARQNVVLELGFFIGKLGRKNTIALYAKDTTLPSDINGVIYIPLDQADWPMKLARELKAAGLSFDAHKVFE